MGESSKTTPRATYVNVLDTAMTYRNLLASFRVKAFKVERLHNLSVEEIGKRCETFKLMSQFEVLL